MLMKPILALSLVSSTCFGVLRLLKDIENFKKDILTFLLPPPQPSQDLKHPSTQIPALQHFDVSNQIWEPVPNQNSHSQFQELQQDYDQQTTSFKPKVPPSTEQTLYREDLLNIKRKFHDKKQRLGSGNCIGNVLFSTHGQVRD